MVWRILGVGFIDRKNGHLGVENECAYAAEEAIFLAGERSNLSHCNDPHLVGEASHYGSSETGARRNSAAGSAAPVVQTGMARPMMVVMGSGPK